MGFTCKLGIIHLYPWYEIFANGTTGRRRSCTWVAVDDFQNSPKIVSENATVGQIVTSINDGPEQWIRLLASFFEHKRHDSLER